MRKSGERESLERLFLGIDQLEKRLNLAGNAVAFFVNGLGGQDYPQETFNHLANLVNTTSGFDWDVDNNGQLDLYVTDWNSPDPRARTVDTGGTPGAFLDLSSALNFSSFGGLFSQSIPTTVDILGVVNDLLSDPPDPVGPGAFVSSLTDILDNEYDNEDFVALIGHSMGGNSVLEVANRTSTEVDLLVTLDPVGYSTDFFSSLSTSVLNVTLLPPISANVGGVTFPLTPEIGFSVPLSPLAPVLGSEFFDPFRGYPGFRSGLEDPSENVEYFYNRWQEQTIFPLDFRASGALDASDVRQDVSNFSFAGRPIAEQRLRVHEFDIDGATKIERAPDAQDYVFGFVNVDFNVNVGGTILDPTFDIGLSIDPVTEIRHDRLPNDPLVQGELNEILNNVVPQAPSIVLSGPTAVVEGDRVRISAQVSDPNPNSQLQYSWERVLSQGNVSLSNSTELNLIPPDGPEDYHLRFVATDETGLSSTANYLLRVANGNPVVSSITAPQVIVANFETQFSSSFDDPGLADGLFQIGWSFGDGQQSTQSRLTEGSVLVSHSFEEAGLFTTRLRVRDKDQGIGTRAKNVEVRLVGLIPDPQDTSKTALAISGTQDDDVIEVFRVANGRYRVQINGVNHGVFSPTGRILVRAARGDDIVRVHSAILRETEIEGGAGDDELIGGSGRDVLVGNRGRDTLTGREGNDLLIGGRGGDRYRFLTELAQIDEISERFDEGRDTVDFSALGVGRVTSTDHQGTTLANAGAHMVRVSAPGQQMNLEVGRNVRPHVALQMGPPVGVTFQEQKFDFRIVDVGTESTHSGHYAWGDGTTAAAMVKERNGVGNAIGTHRYAHIQQFTVGLTVNDDEGLTSHAETVIDIRRFALLPDRRRAGTAFYLGGTVTADVIKLKNLPRRGVRAYLSGRDLGVFTFDAGLYVYSGDGNDVVFTVNAIQKPLTIEGGNDNDLLKGSVEADFLLGQGGKDSVFGRAGDDEIDGGDERDHLYGGSGADSIGGGNGNDVIRSGSGNDVVRGGRGNEVIWGNGGNDLLLGQGNQDVLFGNAGDDILIGGRGLDRLVGAGGDDLLTGEATAFDADPVALRAIQDEWLAASPLSSRVDHLMGVVPGGLNGSVVLAAGSTIFDDAKADVIVSSGYGADWYLVFAIDKARGSSPRDTITRL